MLLLTGRGEMFALYVGAITPHVQCVFLQPPCHLGGKEQALICCTAHVQVSFVNSICTVKGGTHVNHVVDQITKCASLGSAF